MSLNFTLLSRPSQIFVSVLNKEIFLQKSKREEKTRKKTEVALSATAKPAIGQSHFTRESPIIFDKLAGQTLIDLGYEQDRGRIDQCKFE